jgi:hypothetical protein
MIIISFGSTYGLDGKLTATPGLRQINPTGFGLLMRRVCLAAEWSSGFGAAPESGSPKTGRPERSGPCQIPGAKTMP